MVPRARAFLVLVFIVALHEVLGAPDFDDSVEKDSNDGVLSSSSSSSSTGRPDQSSNEDDAQDEDEDNAGGDPDSGGDTQSGEPFADEERDTFRVLINETNYSSSEDEVDLADPACILASIKADLLLPFKAIDGTIVNKTSLVPKESEVQGICGESQQVLTLTWMNKQESEELVKGGKLSLYFEKDDKNTTVVLSHVSTTVSFSSEASHEIPSQEVNMKSAEDSEVWRNPLSCSFYCRSDIEVRLQLDQTEPDGDPVVDSLANGEAFLVFRQVRVEAFRQDKQLFAGSFTMGKCDCRDMWIYPYMPTLVGTALAVLVGMVLVAFFFRRRLGLLTPDEEANGNTHTSISEEHGNDSKDDTSNRSYGSTNSTATAASSISGSWTGRQQPDNGS